MGLCQSVEDKQLSQKSKAIDKEMMQGHIAQQKVVKLLLLGAGECGKSTVLKQMRILHDHGFSQEEAEQQKGVVYNNTVQAMAQILRAMNGLKISLEDPSKEADARVVLDTIKAGQESEPFTPELTQALKNLWADPAVSVTAINRGNEYQLTESAPHFLSSIDRIAAKDYKPTEHDILLSRIKTTGIVEVKFRMKNVDFRVFDVGGQRSERKKWIHCFEDVNAIIFIAAISEYDQVLFEDETTVALILLYPPHELSKFWIAALLTGVDRDHSAQNYDEATAFIEEKFEGLNANPEKTIYIHQTCATDTNQVQMILDSVIDMIIQANLQGCGLY
ncbi:hypothetical protein RB195_012638 [Necator americanus]|uniref:G-protein alpha subunit n=1 Tax=Necator americanus TaxID=51031 RepID=A0ABR1DRV2_NECAM